MTFLATKFGSQPRNPFDSTKQDPHQQEAGDQDDLCFWKHPSEAIKNRIIVSDKKANRVFQLFHNWRAIAIDRGPKTRKH